MAQQSSDSDEISHTLPRFSRKDSKIQSQRLPKGEVYRYGVFSTRCSSATPNNLTRSSMTLDAKPTREMRKKITQDDCVQDLENEIKTSKIENTKLKSRIRELMGKIEVKEEENYEKEKKIIKEMRKAQKMTKEIEEERKENNDLMEQFRESTKKNKDNERTIVELNEQLGESNKKNKENQRIIVDLNEIIDNQKNMKQPKNNEQQKGTSGDDNVLRSEIIKLELEIKKNSELMKKKDLALLTMRNKLRVFIGKKDQTGT